MGILDYLLAELIFRGIKSATNQASREKLKEKTRQEANAAGLSLYAYVKSQLRESVRNTIEEKSDDLESLERYLRACLEQKLISEYYFEVILEEAKGHCALRRLQATGGRPWVPHDILRGLAPENILNHCDKDASSYGLQSAIPAYMLSPICDSV